MKLNDKYSHVDFRIPNNSIYENLNEYFQKILPPLPPVDDNRVTFQDKKFKYLISKDEEEFYESDYIVLTDNFNPINSNLITQNYNTKFLLGKIGYSEKDILELIFAEREHFVNIIAGEVGWGKSTLMRYCVFFLLSKCCKTSNVKPIYIDFNKYINELNSRSIDDFGKYVLENILINKFRKVLQSNLSVDNDELWEYLENGSDFSEYLIYVRNISIIEKNKTRLKKLIYTKRLECMMKTNFVLSCVKFEYAVNKINFVLVIDNVDPLKHKVSSDMIKLFHFLGQEYSIKTIMPMRPNTLSEIKNKHSFLFDAIHSGDIVLSKPKSSMVIEKNLLRINSFLLKDKKTITLENNLILTDIDVSKIIEIMFGLINSEDVERFLNCVSKGDLNNFTKIVREIFMSGLWSTHKIVNSYIKKQLEIHSDNDYNPVFIVYSAVITNNHRTYFPSGDFQYAKDRICNLFCNKFEANRIFIRLHIISFMLKNPKVSLDHLRRKYIKLFSLDDISGAFNFAIRILVNCGILKSNQFHKIDDDGDVDGIVDIEISKDSGKYYFNEMVVNFEYLKYMKDDSDLPIVYYNQMKSCIDSENQYGYIYLFCEFLFDHEQDLIEKYCGSSDKKRHYFKYFAFDQEISFYALNICNKMIDYAQPWRLKNHPLMLSEKNKFEKLRVQMINSINTIKDEIDL